MDGTELPCGAPELVPGTLEWKIEREKKKAKELPKLKKIAKKEV